MKEVDRDSKNVAVRRNFIVIVKQCLIDLVNPAADNLKILSAQ